jgi:hypothetical protein
MQEIDGVGRGERFPEKLTCALLARPLLECKLELKGKVRGL